MKLAIVPGSFDPMTLGHLDLIREAAIRYERVVVAVMQNAEKQYLFTKEERLEIARLTVSALSNVEVIADDGMLIDLYDRLGASAVCKGWRNEKDLAYEQSMADWNAAHNPRFYTELIKSEGDYEMLSSTEVRERLQKEGEVSTLVHPSALPLILTKMKHTGGNNK